jgi:hypothetical protein
MRGLTDDFSREELHELLPALLLNHFGSRNRGLGLEVLDVRHGLLTTAERSATAVGSVFTALGWRILLVLGEGEAGEGSDDEDEDCEAHVDC